MWMLWIGAAGLGAMGLLRLGQGWGLRRDARRHPPPGRMIATRHGRQHVWAQGGGAGPTVVLEAALGGSCLSWSLVQPALAGSGPTWSYDRAGLGWSDASSEPRTLERQAEELRQLLAASGAAGPYLLVGHSYGALLARYYASRHPGEVAGLVLVDMPDAEEYCHPDAATEARLREGIALARRGAWAARWGWARLVAACLGGGASRLAGICVTAVSGGRLGPSPHSRFAPVLKLPSELRPHMRAAWLQPRFYLAVADQLQHLPEAARQVAACPGLGDLPLVVLTAADPSPERRRRQAALAAQSRRGRHVVAATSGHWIPLEDPDLVLTAVREVLAQCTTAVAAEAAG